jgi:ATP-binding cassette subfamily B protein
LTDRLVESMAGHRTRLAQEPRRSRDESEDASLESYLEVSKGLDRPGVALRAMLPRCWLMAGVLALAPAFLAGDRPPTELAIGIGGVVLAYRALRPMAEGVEALLMAAVAWERIGPIWDAASRPEPIGPPAWSLPRSPGPRATDRGRALLDVRDLDFAHEGRSEPVLRRASLRIEAGDRILLEGPSGGGKSTLASLVAGERAPDSGAILVEGLDRGTLGAEGWRRRIALTPQFHENHVLMGTFAFNVLLGRGWPPGPGDLEAAEEVCRGLGLGGLLDRMPAGMFQLVGETGWQLSHGERSRLFLARAMLQGADLVILDEAVAALDPKTLRECLRFVLDRASTLLLIAHP